MLRDIHPMVWFAVLVASAAAFTLGLTMGRNQVETRYHREAATVWVGTGCDDEGVNADFAIVAHDMTSMPWPCKEYEKRRLAIVE